MSGILTKYSLDIISNFGYNIYTVYSVKQAAEKLGLSDRHVRLLLEGGEIKGKKLGHYWVVLGLNYMRKRKPKTKRGGNQ